MSFFSHIAHALGGVAKSLARDVKVAAKFTGKEFTAVTTSPLWKIGAGIAPFVLPGIGIAVSAGMLTASAIGKAGSAKDAIIGAARENLPGGDAAKAGFDIGTGLAIHGEGMTEAAVQAVRNQIPDGSAKAGFDTALSIHLWRVTSTPGSAAPANLHPAAKAAFYASKGLVHGGAPKAMKKAVIAHVAAAPVAKAGLHAAAMTLAPPPREVTLLEWLWQEAKHTGTKIHATLSGHTA